MKTSLILLMAASLWAQDGRVAGPTSGFVFDRVSHALRPVLGVPGGSTIGAPLSSGMDLAAAWVSPNLDFAIAQSSDGSLKLFRMNGDSVVAAALDGTAAAPLNVAYSPTGSAALLSTASGGFVVTGLPNAPRVAGKVDVPDGTHRPLPVNRGGRPALARISLAVSDDGAYVLLAAGGSVRVLTTTGENRKLVDSPDAVAAFAPGSYDAAVADSAGVTMYRNLEAGTSPKAIGSADTVPSGVAFTGDGKRLYVASAAGRSVTSYDVASGTRNVLECECAPAGLVRMGDIFRLNDLSSEPLWVLDTGRPEPRIMFVPALAAN